MQILWEPEEGRCAECGEFSHDIRGFSAEGRYFRLCFACWNLVQDGTIINSNEWRESLSYVFHQEEIDEALQLDCTN
jgi:hypothetical protein